MPKAICRIDDCEDPALARGWCCKHYNRWLKHGDPLFALTIYRDDERRFWSKVNKNGPVPVRRPDLGPCWVWTGSTDAAGYGRFSLGKSGGTTAHRWICELKLGPIPEGYDPDHLCFNTGCVNYVSHLEIVTKRENILRSNGLGAINARKAFCKRGHPFDEANTIWRDGRRACRTCERSRPHSVMSDEAREKRNAARRAATAARRNAR